MRENLQENKAVHYRKGHLLRYGSHQESRQRGEVSKVTLTRRRSSWHEAWRSGLGSRGESGHDKRGTHLHRPTSRPGRTEGPEGKRSPRETHDSVFRDKPGFRAKEVKTLLTRSEHGILLVTCYPRLRFHGFRGGIAGGPEPSGAERLRMRARRGRRVSCGAWRKEG